MFDFDFDFNNEDILNQESIFLQNQINFNEDDDFYSLYNESFNEQNINNNEIEKEKKISENDSLKTKATLNQKKEPISNNNIQKNSINVIISNDSNKIISNIPQEPIEQEQEQEKKDNIKEGILGRKRKNSNETGAHNKYCIDNIIRKIRYLILTEINNYINIYIEKIYNGDIGKGIFKKKLLKNIPTNLKTAKDNKEFLNKKLKDIFSEDISKVYIIYLKDHNKELIKNLLNEEDEEKRIKFNKLFNLTFLDCLKHFIGSKYIEELEGFPSLDIIDQRIDEDQEYLDLFKYYIINFEEIIMKKRTRRNKK